MSEVTPAPTQETEAPVDLEPFAEWLNTTFKDDEAPAPAPGDDGQPGEGGDTPSPEGSNETPAPQAPQALTDADVNRRAMDMLTEAKNRLEAERSEAELRKLLQEGTAEEKAQLLTDMIAANDQASARNQIETAASQAAMEQIFSQVIPESYIQSLAAEDQTALQKAIDDAPDTIEGVMAAINTFKDSHARKGLYTEEDVIARAQEMAKAIARGEQVSQLRTPSPTNTPKSDGASLSAWEGKQGQERFDAMWAQAISDAEKNFE